MSGEQSATGAKLAAAGLTVTVALLCLPLMMFVALTGAASQAIVPEGAPPPAAGGRTLREGAPVPPEYLAWVQRAGATCPEIGPAEIAAQIDLESSWNPNAYADSGEVPAKGIAQFTDATWQTWGGDYDGDGQYSAYDPQDAIVAQGRLMCDLVAWAAHRVAEGRLRGDILDLAWAAYFAGRGGVEAVGGVPEGGPAHDYPQQIRSRLPTYAAEQPAAPVGPGGWTLPIAKGSYQIVSPFGIRGGVLHAGVDLGAPTGTPILAAAAGVVLWAGCDSPVCDSPGSVHMRGCGLMINLNHGGGIVTRYCHAVRLAVRSGQQVTAGQVIAWVGSTGNSSGPHLHFEAHRGAPPAHNGNAVDPVAYLRSAGLNP